MDYQNLYRWLPYDLIKNNFQEYIPSSYHVMNFYTIFSLRITKNISFYTIKLLKMKRFFYLAILFFISFQLTAQTNKRVGVNTMTPEATLHVKTDPADSDPFMVELNDSTKLKTFTNGGTTIGSSMVPPNNGLLVKGTIRPDSGISTPQKLVVESIGNSITMKAGNSEVTIDANGNITVVTKDASAKISIQSAGDLELSGKNINLKATNKVTISSALLMKLNATIMNIAADATMDLNGGILRLNNGGKPIAGQGSTVAVDPTSGLGTVISGGPTVLVP